MNVVGTTVVLFKIRNKMVPYRYRPAVLIKTEYLMLHTVNNHGLVSKIDSDLISRYRIIVSKIGSVFFPGYSSK